MPLDLAILQTQFFITFLFVLAVVFGVLQLTKVFKVSAVNVVIAIVIALFAASYPPFVSTLWTFLPSITWLFVILFFVAFIMELFGLRKPSAPGQREDKSFAMILTGVILIIFITIGINFIPNIPSIGQQNIMILAALFFMFIIFYAAFRIKKSAAYSFFTTTRWVTRRKRKR